MGINVSYGLEEQVYCSTIPSNNEIYYNYIPLLIGAFLTLFNMVRVFKQFKARLKKVRVHFMTLMSYPLILFICWVPGFADKMYIAYHTEAIMWLTLLHVAMARAQGFLNALVYGKSKMHVIKDSVLRGCCGSSDIEEKERTKSKQAPAK